MTPRELATEGDDPPMELVSGLPEPTTTLRADGALEIVDPETGDVEVLPGPWPSIQRLASGPR